MQHVFIVGSKGIPGNYGGYETFVDKLTEYHKENKEIKYHVACKDVNTGEFEYNNAHCFKIKVPNIGAAQAIYYDIAALSYCCKYIKANNIKNPIVYILACRIGPFAAYYKRKINKLGGKVFINPDGHEWLRQKWSAPVRMYWKISEKMMVRNSDHIICDSVNIEKYIHSCYDGQGKNGANPSTRFIAYGADTTKSILPDDEPEYLQWLKSKGLTENEYYLVVGRFVPENNYEVMIREFMKSKSKKDFAIITTVNDSLLTELENKLHFKNDPRIKFVGTVYEQELLKKIRENAYGYLHGHEVGGTNPSLLEALGSTDLNLLLDVGFNKEVAEDNAIYWTKEERNLSKLIEKADKLEKEEIAEYGKRAKARIANAYSWQYIADLYKDVFLNGYE